VKHRPTFYAVVPAAGKSTRMGRSKLSLPFAGRTVLEHVIISLRDSGVQDIVVVTGPHAPELGPLAKGAGANVVDIPHGTKDMRATIVRGLQWLHDYRTPRASDAFLLAPADHPLFGITTVRRMCDAYQYLRSKSIVVPVHAGKRGHPVLIGWRHVIGINEMPTSRGVNEYLREKSEATYELETDDRGSLFNLDNPQDFAALEREDALPVLSSSVSNDIS